MHRVSRAFTLVELLVTIGIIAVLVGIVIVSAKGVRLSAHRAESLSALRQMMTGYAAYSADYDQRLLPGYIAPQDFDPGLPGAFAELDNRIVLPDQFRFDFSVAACRDDAGSYVWRLSPYVDGRWDTFYADYGSPGLIARLNQEFGGQNHASNDGDEIYGRGSRDPDTTTGDVGIGHAPSFGLNSMYLGGDSLHGRSDITNMNPWSPAIPGQVLAASRLSQVKYPSKVITFGACFQANPVLRPADLSSSEIQFGCAELRPPLIARNDPQNPIDPVASNWTTGDDQFKEWGFVPGMEGPQKFEETDFEDGGGLPVGRWGADHVPTATLDGATAIQNPIDMSTDISRWHWDFTIVISSGG